MASSDASNASNVLLDGYEQEEEEVEDDGDGDDEEDDEINHLPTQADKASAHDAAAAVRTAAFLSQDYQDALEEVHTRFILNLPPSELETADRLFFQLEQAWWFYEDWICDKQVPDNQNLPRFATLRPFALKLFEYSPLLPSPDRFGSMWSDFTKYKRKISNYGCILLNANCDKVVLCQVWNSKTFTFPAGKINQGETGIAAAARETYEETGFDPHCEFGRTSEMKEQQTNMLSWNFPLRENDALVYQENDGKRRTCYVCRGVPEDFPFAPVVRKEVAKIDWYPLNDLPRHTYAVSPFLAQLRRWIKKRRPTGTTTAGASTGSTQKSRQRSSQKSRERVGNNAQQLNRSNSAASKTTGGRGDDASAHKSRERGNKSRERDTPSKNRSGNKKSSNTPNRSRQNSRQRLREDDQLVQAGLAEEGDISGWSEEDMFLANEKILGRKIEYDGNPHHFVEQGFGVQDPHAFHVVGGSFLNSTVGSLAPPPETSKLQPLFRNEDAGHGYDNDGDDDGLQPFFSESGATPWGEVISEATTDDEDRGQMHPTPSVSPIRKGGKNTRSNKKKNATANTPTTTAVQDEGTALLAMLQQDGGDSCFLTDREITAQSQARNRRLLLENFNSMDNNNDPSSNTATTNAMMTMSGKPKASSWAERREQLRQQYQRDWEYIQQWVANLPPSPPTKEFGTFRLDANAIMQTAALHVQHMQQK